VWGDIKGPVINFTNQMVHGIIDGFTFMAYSIYSIMYGVLHTIEGVWNAAGAGLSKLASAGNKVLAGDLKGAISEAAQMGAAAGDAFKGAFAGRMSFGDYKKNVGIVGYAHIANDASSTRSTTSAARVRSTASSTPLDRSPGEDCKRQSTRQDRSALPRHGRRQKPKGKKGPDPLHRDQQERERDRRPDEVAERRRSDREALLRLHQDDHQGVEGPADRAGPQGVAGADQC
jgi:hypothetical protein